MSLDPIDAAQLLYRTADGTRAKFGANVEAAMRFYTEFVNFVNQVSPLQPNDKSKDLLDVGCGCGWSSFSFAKAGYRTVGIDVNPLAFEPPENNNLSLRQGNALALPFEACSFDFVVSYQCLEHVPDPEAALKEMVRVCRPNGVVCIVGPNLLSPFLPIKFLIKEILGGSLTFKRRSPSPRHPYGNTALEHLVTLFSTTGLLLLKLVNPQITFTMRVPDQVPPFNADNDACYLCNPTDIARFFRQHNCRVLQNGRHGRPPLSHLIAGGTWVAAKKCAM
jgi:SAM-dependent methyltransferase